MLTEQQALDIFNDIKNKPIRYRSWGPEMYFIPQEFEVVKYKFALPFYKMIGIDEFGRKESWLILERDQWILSKTCNSKQCTCGAKFTSNPKHHLTYCDIKGE